MARGASHLHWLHGHRSEIHLFQDPIEAILHNPVVPIEQRDPGIPLSVAQVINRALSNDPATRYQDAQQFRAALEMA
jgi:hypothetical protein